jgi:hypothetical protein
MRWPLRRDGEAIELPRQSGREVADVDHLLHFAVALRANLAHLERDEIAERFLYVAKRVPEIADQLAPLGGGHLAPREEAGRGRSGHLLVCRRAGQDDLSDRLAGRGIERRQLVAVGRREPAARPRAGAGIDRLERQLAKQRRDGCGNHGSQSTRR